MWRLRRIAANILPRFSLRTLVLFMLLVTAGTGTWLTPAWERSWSLEMPLGYSASLSPDGERVVCGGYAWGPIVVLDARTGTRITEIDCKPELVVVTDLNGAPPMREVIFSAGGSRFVTSGFGRIKVWDAGSLRCVFTAEFDSYLETGNAWWFNVTISADGGTVAAERWESDFEFWIDVWDVDLGERLAQVNALIPGLGPEDLSPDGAHLLVGLPVELGAVDVWETVSARPVARLQSDGGVRSAAFSPCGKWVVTSTVGGTAEIWSVGDWKCRRALVDGPDRAGSAAFLPDGRHVITWRGETASVWDPLTGTKLPGYPVPRYDTDDDFWRHAMFSRDGRMMTREGPGAVIRDVRTGRRLAAIRGFVDGVDRRMSTAIMYLQSGGEHSTFDRAELWRRRRPEWWWGVFWLWEFWLTFALAAAFAWSVGGDRRRLYGATKP